MMNREYHFSKSLRFLIGVAALGVAVVTMQPYVWLINAVLVGIIIAVVSAPMLHWLRRKGLPGGLALLIILLVLATLATAFVVFVVGSVSRLEEAVPTYVEQADSLKATLESTLAELSIDTTGLRALLDLVDPGQLFGFIVDKLAGLADSISNLVVVVLVVAYLLAESLNLPAKVQRQLRLGHTQLAPVSGYIHHLRRYMLLTAELAALTGIGATILLLLLGVDFPILWGVLTFLLSFIPTVGLFLALIPPALLALLEFGPAEALVVVAGYLLIDAVVENVVKPKFLGESLDIAPLVIILSVIVWAAVLGSMGALLAVPLTLAIKELLLEADEDNQWVAELMSSGVDAEAPDDAASEDKGELASQEAGEEQSD
jgi:predicted PurR-regulated permease PerM